MFVGHYGVAFGAKPAAPFLPLWVYFLAVQWLDVVWSILVLLGIEKLHIVPGITEANSYDLYYMPYTHSLPGALALSLLFGAIVAMLSAERRALAFLVIVLAAFSHWVLDLLVHIPDLPLYDDSAKVGLGLWRHVAISLPLELVLLVGGARIYARAVPAKSARGRYALFGLRCLACSAAGLRQFRAAACFEESNGDHGSWLLCRPHGDRGDRRKCANGGLGWSPAGSQFGTQKSRHGFTRGGFSLAHETSLASQRPCKRGYLDDAFSAFFNALSRFALHERTRSSRPKAGSAIRTYQPPLVSLAMTYSPVP